ncbi:hypothetical protein M430DRAFT_26027 [Amorphotheca resinae ATCC 22711]|uniref:Mid2 domain-containing protein n=1 Tax=Amorphotheca resinae ATCC 22711 TaxID=857342 RepID=A0A2T3B8B4_AMORE|nr:hypothetical protein M430DRAFT_26027 [Amorphotheca resinae ATCC 22711]PSS23093.1 hypothetical protein M430DRAFT_26027 [Amorphotheca resinae ATCC 22711]
MRRTRASNVLLTTVCLATSTAAQSSPDLFERASTCGDPAYTQCSQAGLPSNFCCGPSSDCVVLAANTTVLCCPSGSSCSVIKSITCDITQQNATAHPDISLMTTALTGTLPTCGTGCCPFGYSCNSDNNCVINANQDTAPDSSTSSSSSATAASSSSAATSSSSTITPAGNATLHATESSNKFPAAAVLVGFFPGLILGMLLTITIICLIGAHRRKASRRNSGSSFGNISEPQPQSDMRSDFLRKQTQSPSTDAGTTVSRHASVQRVRSLFSRSNIDATPRSSPPGVPPVPTPASLKVNRPMVQERGRPVTPILQREPSYEDINIFADGDTASALRENGLAGPSRNTRTSHQTTFSDMMEKSGLAGLQKGQPYVYRGNSLEYSPTPSKTTSPRGRVI